MTTLSSHNPYLVLGGHTQPVQTIAFSPDGVHMATGDTAMNLTLWRNREIVQSISLHEEWDKVRPTERIRGVAFSRTGDRMFVAAGQCLISYDLMRGDMIAEPEWSYIAPRHFGFLIVSPLAISVSRLDQIAAGFDNGTIGVWPTDGKSRKVWHDNSAPRLLSYLHDGQRIAGTDSFSLSVWDSSLATRIARYKFRERIYGFAASPVEDLVAVRTLHSTSLIRLENGQEIGSAPAGTGLPLVVFSPAGDLVAAGARESIQVLNLEAAEVARIDVPDTKVISLGFAPNGSRVAAGCADGSVRFWDID